jgi:hypothetical protein
MADEYVPVGGWEAAGYGGFSPNLALQTINPYATPTYAPQMSAPQQLLNYSSGVQAGPAAQTTNYQPQSLIASPTQQGYGMTGPVMTNQFSTSRGGAGGGTPAIAQLGSVTTANSAGGYIGLGRGSSAAPLTFEQILQGMSPSNPYGDLSGSQPSNPYGDLSGVPAMTPPSPYGDLSGSQPQPSPTGGATLGNTAATGGAGLSAGSGSTSSSFAGLTFDQIMQRMGSGVQMPGTTPYGGVQGSSMPNPSTTPNLANLPSPNANPVSAPLPQVPGDNYGFPADDQTYMDMPQGPNGQFGSLMGGQDYGDENPWAQSIGSSGSPNPGTVQINTPPSPTPVSTQPQNPGSTGVQMPGGSPFGQLPATVRNTPRALTFDEIMRGGGAGAVNAAGGAGLQGAPQPQQDAYLFPTQPLMSPTNVYADGGYTMQQPAPQPPQQQFQQNMQTQAPSQYQPSFGSMPQFTPMPPAQDTTKFVDRAPQMGGFVSYAPTPLPPVSTPSAPPATGLSAISNALFDQPKQSRQVGDGMFGLFGN